MLQPAFMSAGAELVALSVDPPERSAAVARQLSLPFPILSDTRRKVISAWGVLNAKERGGIAVPSVFVIDRDLRLKMLWIEKTSQRVSPEEVLQFVRTMPNATSANQSALRRVRPGAMFVRAIVNALRRGVWVPQE